MTVPSIANSPGMNWILRTQDMICTSENSIAPSLAAEGVSNVRSQDHLERHIKSHSKEKPHVCWVPGCHRAFARRDNLKAHCTKTHARRGGRNRYVATLDKTSPDYDPGFRGELSLDGHPLKFPALLVPGPEAKFQQP